MDNIKVKSLEFLNEEENNLFKAYFRKRSSLTAKRNSLHGDTQRQEDVNRLLEKVTAALYYFYELDKKRAQEREFAI